MAEIKNGLLLNNDRVFLPSTDINVFPCSRRGQANIEDIAIENSATYYDPEARLNTERTNRLRTALNGFTDSFIKSYEAEAKTLVFVLAGYYVEIKNFDPAIIASTLGEGVDKIYAHLRLHDHVSLGVKDYFTEMLYRQSESELDSNYLDVTYTINGDKGDFFVGVSFTNEPVEGTATHNLQLFSYVNDAWKRTPASLLPKIEHGETENSIKVSGDFTADTITAKNRLNTPVIDTKVIENTADDTGVSVNDALNVTAGHTVSVDTVKVNTINSRQENGTVTIESPVTLTKGLEVQAGNTVLNGNLAVEDNINVGTPSSPATADKGGCIVAKFDITAEEDIIAKRDIDVGRNASITKDLVVSGNATVKTSLVVGERTSADSTDAGAITAKTSVKTPLLNVTNHYNAQAYIDNATIPGELKVQNNGTAKITTDAITVTGATNLQKLNAKETNLESLAIAGDATPGSVLTVNGNTTVKNDLNVTSKTTTSSLEVTAVATIPQTLNVQSNDDTKPATANIDKAVIKNANITNISSVATAGINNANIVNANILNKATIDIVDATKITANEIWLDTADNTTIGQVPALEIAHLNSTDTYQLRFKFGKPITIKEE